MQMKLLESADVLDDQIDRMISLYQDQNKTADLQFGNPCMSTQSDIYVVEELFLIILYTIKKS